MFLNVSVNSVAAIISGSTIANNGNSGIEGVAVGLGLGQVEELGEDEVVAVEDGFRVGVGVDVGARVGASTFASMDAWWILYSSRSPLH